MKISKKIAQICIFMVITGLAFGMITYVNQSVCAIAFHQRKQPVNIQNNYIGGFDNEEIGKVLFD